jgi:hypothetical protein
MDMDWLKKSVTSNGVPLTVTDPEVIAALVVLVKGLDDPGHVDKVNVESSAIPLGPSAA